MARVTYFKSLGVGLLAGILAVVVQAALFSRVDSSYDGGPSFDVIAPTRVYGAPVVIASVVASLGAWWKLRHP
jgi:hypothetical protein